MYLIFRWENVQKSALYTYEVDACVLVAFGVQLLFPWIYQFMTGTTSKQICRKHFPSFTITTLKGGVVDSEGNLRI